MHIGRLVFSTLLTLLAVHYTCQLSYNPLSQQVLEFLQEKLLGNRLPGSRKMSAAYSNLFRAVNSLEQRLHDVKDPPDDEDPEESEDATQAFCDF